MRFTNDSNLDKHVNDKISLKYSVKNERNFFKAIILSQIHRFLYDLFDRSILTNKKNNSSMESYVMDSKILQLLLQGIVETGEYTLEGIAFYTNIPFDVIYDAACGISYHLSVTAWAKVVDLYLQVKPEIAQVLNVRLQVMVEKKHLSISSLISESY